MTPDEGPPTFSSVAEERQHLLEELARGYRVLGRARFGEAGAGHISARDPERPELYWMARFGVGFSDVTVDDLNLVDHEGNVVEGAGLVNFAGFCIHTPLQQARPDIVSACHSHGAAGVSWSTLGKPLPPLTQESCMFIEDQAVWADEQVSVETLDGGRRLAAALGPHRLLVMRNHGLLTAGPTIGATVAWYVWAERVADAALRAYAAGEPHLLSMEAVRAAAKDISSPEAAWLGWRFLVSTYDR